MVAQIIAALRRSPVVNDIDVSDAIEEESFQYVRVSAEIVDGSLLHIRELLAADHSKYSYHWQAPSGKLLLRWDNAPHHPHVSTHPDHKHEGEQIVPSARVLVEEVLREIAERLKRVEPSGAVS